MQEPQDAIVSRKEMVEWMEDVVKRIDMLERLFQSLVGDLNITDEHLSLLQDSHFAQTEDIRAILMGLRRTRADMPDSGRTIEQVSARMDGHEPASRTSLEDL
tara:strand:+ start:28 stop:336 length:309 start_codon:yes stop_codon:yes gene_type:complete